MMNIGLVKDNHMLLREVLSFKYRNRISTDSRQIREPEQRQPEKTGRINDKEKVSKGRFILTPFLKCMV